MTGAQCLVAQTDSRVLHGGRQRRYSVVITGEISAGYRAAGDPPWIHINGSLTDSAAAGWVTGRAGGHALIGTNGPGDSLTRDGTGRAGVVSSIGSDNGANEDLSAR